VPRYKLTIAYDGTDFCGWQKQFPHADAVPPDVAVFKEGDPRGWEAEAAENGPPLSAAPTSPPPPDQRAVKRAARREDQEENRAPTGGVATTSPLGEVRETAADDRPRRELRTVQAVVERAVRHVVREPVVISGSSRTDAGVHARGQVASFRCSPVADADSLSAVEPLPPPISVPREPNAPRGLGWPVERGTIPLMRAINARLPDDVLVRAIEVVPDEFNPITDCVAKGYSYTLWCADHRPLWQRKTALHLWHRLDVAAMQAAAAEIVGEHDFAGFAAAGHGRATTVRTVFDCEVIGDEPRARAWEQRIVEKEEGAEAARHRGIKGGREDEPGEAAGPVQKIVIRVSGSGFLWNMVRIIAGTLVDAGRGKSGPERIREALRTGDRRLAGPTLPAHGLCLEWIRYGPSRAWVDEE